MVGLLLGPCMMFPYRVTSVSRTRSNNRHQINAGSLTAGAVKLAKTAIITAVIRSKKSVLIIDTKC
jgi:hypothetical protein